MGKFCKHPAHLANLVHQAPLLVVLKESVLISREVVII